MLRLILIIGFIAISAAGQSQFNKVVSKTINYAWFNCDANKTIYLVNNKKLFKYLPPYDSAVYYDFTMEGLPSYIDINNPNQIILFYENSYKLIILNSDLKEIERPFFLDELGLFDISMIFASTDKGLWFYNYVSNSLTKLNTGFMPLVRGLSLNPYFRPPHSPNFIATFTDKIYLNVPSYGILVINQNGSYLTAIQLQGLVDFQVDDEFIYYYRDNIIFCYQQKTLKTRRIYIPEEPETLNAWFYRDQIIVLTRNGFRVYDHKISPAEE